MKPTDNVMQSFGRCCAIPSFFEDFYTTFLASSPLVRAKFVETDMNAQRLLLRQGILNLVMFARGMPDTKLRALADSHSRHKLNIEPELYLFWIEALLVTIRRHDPEYTAALRQDWIDILNQGISIIKSGY